jgi:hypothetical protein
MEASKKRKRLPPPERVRSKKIGLLSGFGANYKPSSDFIHQVELSQFPSLAYSSIKYRSVMPAM